MFFKSYCSLYRAVFTDSWNSNSVTFTLIAHYIELYSHCYNCWNYYWRIEKSYCSLYRAVFTCSGWSNYQQCTLIAHYIELYSLFAEAIVRIIGYFLIAHYIELYSHSRYWYWQHDFWIYKNLLLTISSCIHDSIYNTFYIRLSSFFA